MPKSFEKYLCEHDVLLSSKRFAFDLESQKEEDEVEDGSCCPFLRLGMGDGASVKHYLPAHDAETQPA